MNKNIITQIRQTCKKIDNRRYSPFASCFHCNISFWQTFEINRSFWVVTSSEGMVLESNEVLWQMIVLRSVLILRDSACSQHPRCLAFCIRSKYRRLSWLPSVVTPVLCPRKKFSKTVVSFVNVGYQNIRSYKLVRCSYIYKGRLTDAQNFRLFRNYFQKSPQYQQQNQWFISWIQTFIMSIPIKVH